MRASLFIKEGGASTTIQDFGRVGYQSLGIPVSGALDSFSLRLANALLANEQNTAALEIRLLGPTIRVEAEAVRVCLFGTDASIQILEPEQDKVASGQTITFNRGTVFRIGAITDVGCCYLAVEGGFAIDQLFGSQSTYTRGGIGGWKGRTLRSGDSIPLKLDSPSTSNERRLSLKKMNTAPAPIRVVKGPQHDYFSNEGLDTFFSNAYSVTTDIDRMGMRLDGPAITHARGFNIPSDGIVTGAVQVPGNGLPIILLADRQTTGGYPKIGCVISSDLARLGCMCPGDIIRFSAVSVSEAEAIRHSSESNLNRLIESIKPISDKAFLFEDALYTENLITGAEWITDEE